MAKTAKETKPQDSEPLAGVHPLIVAFLDTDATPQSMRRPGKPAMSRHPGRGGPPSMAHTLTPRILAFERNHTAHDLFLNGCTMLRHFPKAGTGKGEPVTALPLLRRWAKHERVLIQSGGAFLDPGPNEES